MEMRASLVAAPSSRNDRQDGAPTSAGPLSAAPSGRAAALHRRALDAAEVGEAEPELRRPEAARPAATLPGSGALAVALVGLALGLGATAVVLSRGWDPGAVAVGPWVAHPRIGTAAIDPYARAALARSGAVPMAAGEGLAFTAATDGTGYRLLRSCFYRLSGSVPPARFWTLTASDPDGTSVAGAAGRAGFTSASVIRDAEGEAAIEVGPRARPGNWLPTSGDGPLLLTLRLYGTPLAGDPAEVAGADLPALVRQGCG